MERALRCTGAGLLGLAVLLGANAVAAQAPAPGADEPDESTPSAGPPPRDWQDEEEELPPPPPPPGAYGDGHAPPERSHPAPQQGFPPQQPPPPQGQPTSLHPQAQPPPRGARRTREPPPDRRRSPRIIVGPHFGFAGQLDDDVPADLQATYGAHLRFDFPIGDYFALGPYVLGSAWRSRNAGDLGRNGFVNVDVFPRGRFPFSIGEGHMEVYVGLPVGFTISIVNEEVENDLGFGWNVSALAGWQVYFGGSIGFAVEVGWIHHEATHSTLLIFDVENFATNQVLVNAGLSILLGGE